MELGIELLPGYLAECDRVKRGSNYRAVNAARTRAADRMFEFAREVLAAPSVTLDGVAIKARAVAALRLLRSYERRWSNIADIGLHEQNMAALLGQALVDVLTTKHLD
ncbi:hypothetical protein [Rhodobacter sp. 24-YEA-8]|uniref:hypothetical protein n=1 Tax=Rhodobacter sp. 24-YEA-8 TaxID=1884310 RepID=UPI00089C7E1C|nr:hypothetical protein [Rhodobacter sp. 24-YEA-8]SEC27552.1 hypothetical protein SAMN05519105_2268 [Rhodobacter sp. 24-YEA-8]